ncbi:MAG: glycosyltransferase [Gemmatimonadota bacterium]
MTSPPDLVLLTATYPFGDKSETFLGVELEVLARRFSRILILPSHHEKGVRQLPPGVELVEMPWLQDTSPPQKIAALASRAGIRIAASVVGPGADPRERRAYLGKWKMYGDILARNLMKARMLEVFIRERALHEAIFYDYWFENSTVALSLLRRQGKVRTAVSRAHGFDIYDERWGGLPIPFRRYKAEGLDAVYAVSRFGADYLRRRVPAQAGKVTTAYLGVPSQADAQDGSRSAALPLILTCGSLIPSKRTHRVPEVLAALRRPLRWVHLGDGPERGRVVEAARRLPPEVEWTLAGHVKNEDVYAFYRRNRVDVLLSLSLSEGLPVSMMEAMSFGVPVVAAAVHGIPEIVTETTGKLLAPDASMEEAAAAVEEALTPGRFDRRAIQDFQRAHFDAETNFNAFADALIHLSQRS